MNEPPQDNHAARDAGAERASIAPLPAGTWIRDDRGAKCRVYPRSESREPLESERDGVDWTFTLPLLGCLGFLLTGVCLVAAMAYAGLSTLTRQAPILTPIVIGGVVAVVFVSWSFWRVRLRRRRGLAAAHARLWLLRERCAGCGYSLAGLDADPDGCRQCPECGAAWRVLDADRLKD